MLFFRHLTEKYRYIDKQKICAWGWSYGGYISGLLLAKDNMLSETGVVTLQNEDGGKNGENGGKYKRLVAFGIAVAPVTEWHHYGKVIEIEQIL